MARAVLPNAEFIRGDEGGEKMWIGGVLREPRRPVKT